MCTAISVTHGDNYFGRNLDYEFPFGEKIIITPRLFEFSFKNGMTFKKHFAIIGMGILCDNFPLYFDATNEMGLSVAGLNFPYNAKYKGKIDSFYNVASFEFIPFLLAQCKSVDEACKLILKINITNEAFSDKFKPSPLHFIVADKFKSVVVEQTEKGLLVFENPVGVLTNNPPFDVQMFNLNNYMSVTSKEIKNLFSDKVDLKSYSRGMGGLGLPGDLSSASRFVKTSFLNLNAEFYGNEEEKVSQFFSILYSVYQIRGAVKVGNDYEITHYTSCCNTDKGIYYYTTYKNLNICGVSLFNENLDTKKLISYELLKREFFIQNAQGES